jgi:type I restriction enzyme S subunit
MNTSVIRFKAKQGLVRSYMLIYLKSKYFKDQIDLMITGGAQPNFGPVHLNRVLIPLPPTNAEQEAIAEALSDSDALIESLEQLLAKKRHLKQGAMQELLTGKRRLPEFSSAWEPRQLKDLADIRSGGTPSTTQPEYWDGDVLWCTPTDITELNGFKYLTDTSRKISQLGLKSSSAEIIPSYSVVMTSRATIGECAINKVPVTTNQGFKNFVPFEHVDVEFLFYLLSTQKQGFISLCGGSTFLEIGKTQLAGYEVRMPDTKDEQAAIATILSDMDAEIADLETQLAKTRALKQGMMQKLLTGEIRLL